MGQATLNKVWQALFPKPHWVREFESALAADHAARQRLYESWESVLRAAPTSGGSTERTAL
jgi:hypothetical protein